MSCNGRLKDRMILSFDVEDNFTQAELKNSRDWSRFEGQVVENTAKTIALLKKIDADATFFVVGRVAERHPQVVKMIYNAGYEVASHGYLHDPVDQMTIEVFKNDLLESLKILESLTQEKIQGFRARSFSITARTLWAIDILRNFHLRYDSSMTEIAFNDIKQLGVDPQVGSRTLNLQEIPVCARRFLGRKVIISGGVVFRLLPLFIYRKMIQVLKPKNSPPIIYAHVWEFNKNQPVRKVGFLQGMAQSAITYTTNYYKFVSIRSYLSS